MPELVSVITAWDEGAAVLGEATWANRVAYCRRHGYGLRGGLVHKGGFWVKPRAVLDSLADGDGWACWLDADVLVTTPGAALYWLDCTPADLVYSADINGLNAGVLFVRNTDWSRAFVTRWLSSRPMYERHPNADQSALAHLLHGEPREKWEAWPQRTFNSYRYGEYGLVHPEGEWQKGDFALHLPGLSDGRRLEILREFGVAGI